MKIRMQRMLLLFAVAEYKLAHATGNMRAEHNALDKIAMLHTHLRVLEEQSTNAILFHH